MSRLQGPLRTSALVTAVAFPHHASQEKTALEPRRDRRAGFVPAKRGTPWRKLRISSRETAERIFADLADAQTINRDKKGGWKAPLWQALTEAGLPLSWVSEECGGSGASLAEGFSVLSAAGRFAVGVPLAETMLAGWLLSQAKIASPDGEMTVAPAGPKDRITVDADGTLSGRGARHSLRRGRQTHRGTGASNRRSFDRAGRARLRAGSRPASILAATAATR